ncbi:hypothetical protein IB685_05555 [Francisella tularensis subsp. novicida FSC159]|uniref:hypothetical protein n=1 Tax=Francisella tularensis TaxID=263 RepID=UPI000515CC2B|nr:hypothetical protein [Francisella tularensis]AJI72964.1 putative membrane protein [Francisella tularensis subsp. novicida D9876]MBK2111623.1 hypothetical protein [Francisella tularensis subsp. novicida FSC159]
MLDDKNIFLAKAAVKIFIVLEIGFTLFFVVLSIIFFNMYGLHGLTIGFFVNYMMYFTTCLIIFLYKFREEGK